MQITNENYISYTFNVETTSSGEEFYNFIVSSDQAGNVMDMRLLEYTPSSTWLNDKTQPFSGHVKLIKNTFFDESDVSNLFNSRGNDECIVDVGWQSKCDLGGIGHYPGHPACTDGTSWEYTPVFTFGSCPEEISAGDSLTGSFPIDTSGENGTSTNGGETSTDDSTNNDGSTSTEVENCIVDSNGDCPIETVIMTPKDKECSSNNQLGNIMEALNLSFDSPLVACLSNESNCDQTNAMGDYLLENNNSQESIVFATEAAVAICNGGEVDFTDRIIIDSSMNETKIKCVHDKLSEEDDFYKKMLNKFNNSAHTFLRFEKGVTPNGDWGITNVFSSGFDAYNITISDNLENNSNLSKMITLSHELVHAYMFKSLKDYGILTFDSDNNPIANINCDSGVSYNNINLNTLSESERWVALICAYNENNPGGEQWLHELFNTANFDVDTYREKLEQLILTQNDWNNESLIFKLTMQSEFGANWIAKTAEISSWIGLEETDEFQIWVNNEGLQPVLDSSGNVVSNPYSTYKHLIKVSANNNCN